MGHNSMIVQVFTFKMPSHISTSAGNSRQCEIQSLKPHFCPKDKSFAMRIYKRFVVLLLPSNLCTVLSA